MTQRLIEHTLAATAGQDEDGVEDRREGRTLRFLDVIGELLRAGW